MKGKIVKMHLFYENTSGWEVVEKKDTKWLFIGMSDNGWKKVSLSGNDKDDAYLLRILENAVVQTISETNRIDK
jgi:hypothetical protein